MAYLTHGPGAFVPQSPDRSSSYCHAVFRAFDDASSRSASASATASVAARDSPAAAAPSTSLNPFNDPPHVLPPAFPAKHSSSAAAAAAASPPEIHPSTLELAEGLIRMSASVEPISRHASVLPRDRSSRRETAPAVALHPQPQPIPGPLDEHEAHHAAPPADHPWQPTVSASSDDIVGRHSDVFSPGQNSDTITDPDVDLCDSALSALPHLPGTSSPDVFSGPATARQPVASPLVPTPAGLIGGSPQISNNTYPDMAEPPGPPPGCRLYDPAAPILPVHGGKCHCDAVPDVFITILNEAKSLDVNSLAEWYGACRGGLCSLHLNAYARLITNALEASSASPSLHAGQSTVSMQQLDQNSHDVVQTGSGTRWRPFSRRARATSIPGIEEFTIDVPAKRRRISGEGLHGRVAGFSNGANPASQSPPEARPIQQATETPNDTRTGYRPIPDLDYNEQFRGQVLAEIAQSFTDRKEEDWSRGETTNRYIYDILSRCKHPNMDPSKGTVEAGFFDAKEAAEVVEKDIERFPIFTAGQQQFQWNSNERPIEQLFRRMEDLSRNVSVQIPSHNFEVPSYETKTLLQIKERFAKDRPSPDPWNILDLRNPLPPSILPSFLTGENCQLLPRIRDSLLEGRSAERTKASREEWNEWTELLEWVLMSEGGHNTAPHMDSHGWSTWFTIQEGNFGFGWLSQPTNKEQNAWIADPLGYTGGNWRFVILQPGQTVFFPSGTVHFVFRLRAQQTLALGGHLLQWTALERWAQIILYQLKNPNITNEDLGTAPLKYIRSARKLVENRLTTSRIGTMGGMPKVTRFMVLATEVERWYNKKKKKRTR